MIKARYQWNISDKTIFGAKMKRVEFRDYDFGVDDYNINGVIKAADKILVRVNIEVSFDGENADLYSLVVVTLGYLQTYDVCYLNKSVVITQDTDEKSLIEHLKSALTREIESSRSNDYQRALARIMDWEFSDYNTGMIIPIKPLY